MATSANALLTKPGLTILDVANTLAKQEHVGKVSITPSSVEDSFMYINFTWHGEQRHMAVFFDGNGKCDYETIYPEDALYCHINMHGFSDAIIMFLVNTFEGFYRLNDCEDEWKFLEKTR